MLYCHVQWGVFLSKDNAMRVSTQAIFTPYFICNFVLYCYYYYYLLFDFMNILLSISLSYSYYYIIFIMYFD